MFGHVKSLKRVGAADGNSGTSIQRAAGPARKPGAAAAPAAAPTRRAGSSAAPAAGPGRKLGGGTSTAMSGPGRKLGSAAAPSAAAAASSHPPRKAAASALPSRAERSRAVAEKRKAGFGAGGPNIKQVVQGRTRSVTATAAKGGKPDCAFEKRKGVVNGLGGAKDLTRKTGSQAAGVQRGAGNIVGFAGPVEARAPTKRLAARAKPALSGAATSGTASAAPRKVGVGGRVGSGVSSRGGVPAKPAVPRTSGAAQRTAGAR